jgi:hypothetical protein
VISGQWLVKSKALRRARRAFLLYSSEESGQGLVVSDQ